MRRLAFLAAPALLGGCATIAPEPLASVVMAPASYAADLPPAGLDQEWWRGFDDPVLDALIERGLAANLDVEAAADRLRAAEALLRAELDDASSELLAAELRAKKEEAEMEARYAAVSTEMKAVKTEEGAMPRKVDTKDGEPTVML